MFAQFDHASGARDVEMELPPELVVVFGNPRAGTPLMQANPRVGIELPLRVLIWDEGGRTIVGYKDPTELADAYDLKEQLGILQKNLALLEKLVAQAAGTGARS